VSGSSGVPSFLNVVFLSWISAVRSSSKDFGLAGDGLGGVASSRRREDSFERASAKAKVYVRVGILSQTLFPLISYRRKNGPVDPPFGVTAATPACGGACVD
jgi:hypothetical protein